MNIIFITIDSLRADFVGVNGNDWIRTPNLDRFANAGVLFKRAYPESIPTLQVRRALFTGRRCYPFSDWVFDPQLPNPGWVPVPKDQKVLAEILAEQGYRTALVTDVFHTFRPNMNFHRGFDEWRWIRGQEYDRIRSDFSINYRIFLHVMFGKVGFPIRDLLPPGSRTMGLAPSLLELSQQAGDYRPMLESSRLQGDLLAYATALLFSRGEKETRE